MSKRGAANQLTQDNWDREDGGEDGSGEEVITVPPMFCPHRVSHILGRCMEPGNGWRALPLGPKKSRWHSRPGHATATCAGRRPQPAAMNARCDEVASQESAQTHFLTELRRNRVSCSRTRGGKAEIPSPPPSSGIARSTPCSATPPRSQFRDCNCPASCHTPTAAALAETDCCAQDGEFKKAAPEEIAKRRIVKARRGGAAVPDGVSDPAAAVASAPGAGAKAGGFSWGAPAGLMCLKNSPGGTHEHFPRFDV